MSLSKLDDICVLIPAAGRVPEGILAFSNITCPAMIPVAGRPLIYWTMQYLLSLGLKRYVIAVARKQMFLEDFVACTFGRSCTVRFIVPTEDLGVGGTIRDLVQASECTRGLIVLGDTHFQFKNVELLRNRHVTVLTSDVEDPYRWCTVDVDARGQVQQFHDKSSSVATPAKALIGVYYFPDLQDVRRASQEAVDANRAEKCPTEIAHILKRLHGPIETAPAREWLDCGNPDRQAASHQALLQKRAFNELNINPVLGTITKRSRHTEKFLDEINYLRLLPRDVAALFPRVLDYATDWENSFLTMEYYGYPTLAEVLVFENVDPGIWEQVFVHLRTIIRNAFATHKRPLSPGVLREMYINKTQKRLQELGDHPVLGELIQTNEFIQINGINLRNLPALWEQANQVIESMIQDVTGTLVHGDLCLSNILYDLRCRICKLIDPRGSFGVPGIYGDPRYDIAKMYHSVYGLYDLITSDLFDVDVKDNALTLEIRNRSHHEEICRRFERVFFGEYDRREILLLTGLLFASMPALHYDFPNRQVAMYARAVQLLNEALEPVNSTVPAN